MKKLFVALTILSCTLVSCTKNAPSFTVDRRVPQSKSFVERTLPDGFVIGSNLPAGVQAVDLGLSVKWANMNVGAKSEKEPGVFYAWGEIFPSKNYSWASYEHNDFHASDPMTLYITKYCFDKYGEGQDVEAGASLNKLDDAAYVNWGSHYRMPTADEARELLSNCTFKYSESTDENKNVLERYITVTSKVNGNKIIFQLPLELPVYELDYDGMSMEGFWTSDLSYVDSSDAISCDLSNNAKKPVVTYSQRFIGMFIRPVYVD